MSETYTLNQARQHPKTINRVFAARTRVNGLAVVDGVVITTAQSSVVATAALTARLAAAAYDGTNLPLQVANGKSDYTGDGVITAAYVDIFDATSKRRVSFETATGEEEVYGKLVEAAGVYTLEFKYQDAAGVEQSATVENAAIDFEFDYAYRFEDVPFDFATTITSRNVQQDASVAADKYFSEVLTLTADNQIPKLSKVAVANSVVINFTGHQLREDLGHFTVVTNNDPNTAAPRSVIGNSIVVDTDDGVAAQVVHGEWDPTTNAPYSLLTGEKIAVSYKVA